MKLTITESAQSAQSAPSTPRTWTREQLENGTAPEGLYANCHGRERYIVLGPRDDRATLLLCNDWTLEPTNCSHGPFTHVATIEEIVLRIDRSKAVR